MQTSNELIAIYNQQKAHAYYLRAIWHLQKNQPMLWHNHMVVAAYYYHAARVVMGIERWN